MPGETPIIQLMRLLAGQAAAPRTSFIHEYGVIQTDIRCTHFYEGTANAIPCGGMIIQYFESLFDKKYVQNLKIQPIWRHLDFALSRPGTQSIGGFPDHVARSHGGFPGLFRRRSVRKLDQPMQPSCPGRPFSTAENGQLAPWPASSPAQSRCHRLRHTRTGHQMAGADCRPPGPGRSGAAHRPDRPFRR